MVRYTGVDTGDTVRRRHGESNPGPCGHQTQTLTTIPWKQGDDDCSNFC